MVLSARRGLSSIFGHVNWRPNADHAIDIQTRQRPSAREFATEPALSRALIQMAATANGDCCLTLRGS